MAKKPLRRPKAPRRAKTALRKRVTLLGKDVWRLTQANAQLFSEKARIESEFWRKRAALRDLLGFYDKVQAVKGEPGHDPSGWSTAEILRLAEIRALAR